MKLSTSRIEFAALLAFILLGTLLRAFQLELEAVEHFDEGIYASPLWYDGQFGEPYPARQFYAPPLLSGLMEAVSWIPPLARFAPFLPSAVLGSGTIVALWWLARSWFGKPAGLFVAAIVACSDFHVLYSRMALTDVACLFWIAVAVGLGSRAVARQCFKNAIAAGFVCGLAWWTKYTGWLPLAILCSGTGFWWIWQGRKTISFLKLTVILATIVFVAAITFAPWWWQLQLVGGYQAVSQTHASYVTGWPSWSKHLARQLQIQFQIDGIAGQLSLGIGLFAAGLLRWTSGRSTWNTVAGDTQSGPLHAPALSFPPFALLVRFTGAAVAISVIAFRIWTPLLLLCITFAGLTGIYLWPVLQRSWLRRETKDLSPTSPGAVALSVTDLECAPTTDPSLGFSITLAWFVGMLLATPMYTPYGRLFFPLLASIWLSAAAGVGWWLESNLSVARRVVGTGEPKGPRSWGQRLVSAMLAAAVITSFFRFDENLELALITREEAVRSELYNDRRSIVMAAEDIADACVRDVSEPADSQPLPGGASSGINMNSITPSALLAAADAANPSSNLQSASGRQHNQLTADERSRTKMIIYVYGEPALLFHLSQTGVIAAPVSHLNLRDPGNKAPAVPTFVVFGPNAKRTDGFWEELLQRSEHLSPVSRIDYLPSLVTLLDMFAPGWISDHPDSTRQTFEIHRVQ